CTWQHEYDHLDGILFPNRVTDMQSFCSWQAFQAFQAAAYAEHVQQLVEVWGS
ncbi:MAG: peptide deformylase, partial [Proteobacteria bacterium]